MPGKKMKCTSSTSLTTKLKNMKDLDGLLKDLLGAAFSILPTLQKESDCPEFWRIFELGFLSGFQFFQIKEAKRHQKDASDCISDVKVVQDRTGIKLKSKLIPEKFWFKVKNGD